MHSLTMFTKVKLDPPLIGAQIIEAVRQILPEDQLLDAFDPARSEYHLIGQISEHLWQHLIVTSPKPDITGLVAELTYDEVIIKPNFWPGAWRLEQDTEVASLTNLLDFTRRFEAAISAIRYKVTG